MVKTWSVLHSTDKNQTQKAALENAAIYSNCHLLILLIEQHKPC